MRRQLPESTAEVWILDLARSQAEVEDAHVLLSEDERERAARFRFPVDRDRFVLARAGLRRILAAYEGIDPTEIAFEYSKFGKPKLRTSHANIKFNASHSAERGLVACTRGLEVGVDIECLHRNLDVDDLARRFFSEKESEKLSALPDDIRRLAFFRCWTCKESYLKAVGKGLSLGLDQFDVSMVVASPAMVLSRPNQEFALENYFLVAFGVGTIDGYSAALIVNSTSHVTVSSRYFET